MKKNDNYAEKIFYVETLKLDEDSEIRARAMLHDREMENGKTQLVIVVSFTRIFLEHKKEITGNFLIDAHTEFSFFKRTVRERLEKFRGELARIGFSKETEWKQALHGEWKNGEEKEARANGWAGAERD